MNLNATTHDPCSRGPGLDNIDDQLQTSIYFKVTKKAEKPVGCVISENSNYTHSSRLNILFKMTPQLKSPQLVFDSHE